MRELNYEEALNRAEALCSRSEHSTGEMARKLWQWGLTKADAERIIDHLVDERYIDNQRFAHAFCLDKLRYNAWGRIKIAQALRQHGVDNADIADALAAIDADEYRQILDTVLRRKLRTMADDEDDYTRRGKLLRHVMSHGFEPDLAIKAVEELFAK